MVKEYFVGKICRVYYNDQPYHVAYITGLVKSYDPVSKEVIIKNNFNNKTTAVTRIRMELVA